MTSRYGYGVKEAEAALRGVAGPPNVSIEDSVLVARPFDLWSAGLDFADALHLVCRGDAESVAPFDDKLVKRAKRAGVTAIAQLR